MAITAVGESQDFNYTGDIQSFTAPYAGLYKLEAWGAGNSAKGAYAARYVPLEKGDTLYIACGGQGSSCWIDADAYPGSTSTSGGWNGGGAAYANTSSKAQGATGGSGATHIAITKRGDGQLSNYASYQSEVLVVAGGASGSSSRANNSNDAVAGAGYGTTSYGFGIGQSINTGNASGGGGGGWYGGGAAISTGGYTNDIQQRPSGGTSYIGVTSDSSTTTYKGVDYTNSITAGGGNTGTGTVAITYVVQATIFHYNDVEITELIYNGVKISSLIFDGTKIF